MKHPNIAVLENLYSAFSKNDFEGVLALCSDKVTFQIQGKSPLAGKYTRADFASGLMTRIQELSGGTFRLEAHDILASDLHAAVLVTSRLKRAGKEHEYRAVHVWRFEGNQPLAWYEYPRDLYQFDALWS